jgi:hypothetical protein
VKGLTGRNYCSRFGVQGVVLGFKAEGGDWDESFGLRSAEIRLQGIGFQGICFRGYTSGDNHLANRF